MKDVKSSNQKNEKQTKKQKYTTPKLFSLGDIRDVTMGGSPGVGDSGAGGSELPFA
ncbi:MAG TPA: lasso RiPP family leader peptide-containing protein [Gammaproteobacteria bacterium]|jgi:hypothetical protein|nr:lasso RiPP family leader peptide-containing protein [Xanthomonadales bacterium]HOP21407.1 lasso RiPP family leader peptide-containing protein [Gammaproteobacteria bacterium]MCB1593894.1 lasso RiPP family leader peptide-containing protein [Xanthomonadales bacterium]MCB1604487.1 lasso RiPP family leader peptide-containing protein [Xanthomonadales bacterium]HPI94683.1 lasso RiPP family leader peptide-containing protein [Gammaproteobacteria bacterium]